MCADGRPDATPYGVRFATGTCSDAYLGRSGPAQATRSSSGTVAMSPEPTELTDDEAATFWLEVLAASTRDRGAVQAGEAELEALGNGVPHLHVHLVPRYLDDDTPGRPLSARHFDDPAWIAAGADLAHDVAALKRSIRPPTRTQGRVHHAT